MFQPQPIQIITDRHQADVLLQGDRPQLLKHLAVPASSTSLASHLELPRQKVNYHLRALEDVGLVHLVEERKARNCTERILQASAYQYILSPEILEDLSLPISQQERFSSAYLLNLAADTIRDLGILRAKAQKANQTLATLGLDGEIAFGSPAERHAFAQELSSSITQLIAKYHRPDQEQSRRFRLCLSVYPARISQSEKEPPNDTSEG